MLNNAKNTFNFDEPIKKFDELYLKESNQFVKQIIVLLQAQIASLSISKDDFKEKIANRLIEEIKVDSYLLNLNPNQWIETVFEPRKKEIDNEAARSGFVDK